MKMPKYWSEMSVGQPCENYYLSYYEKVFKLYFHIFHSYECIQQDNIIYNLP